MARNADAEDAHGPIDVLEGRFAEVVALEIELAERVFTDTPGDGDATGLGERFDAGGDVNAIAENIVGLNQDVALVKADTELQGGRVGLLPGLDGEGAAEGLDGTRKFGKQAVPGGFEDATAMFGHERVDNVAAERVQAVECAGLIFGELARVGDHVRGEDCREAAAFGHQSWTGDNTRSLSAQDGPVIQSAMSSAGAAEADDGDGHGPVPSETAAGGLPGEGREGAGWRGRAEACATEWAAHGRGPSAHRRGPGSGQQRWACRRPRSLVPGGHHFPRYSAASAGVAEW